MAAEPIHEQGREGARRAKRWLDATTKVRIEWDAYTAAAQCRIRRPDGTKQLFDLAGVMYLGGPSKPLLVECKNYTTPGSQATAYKEYLADAYFATEDRGADAELQFMWVTWHPFDQGRWQHLCAPLDISSADGQDALDETAQLIADAVSASVHRPENEAVDASLCRVVAQRLWMVVLNERQETYLTLDEETLAMVRGRVIAEGAR